MAISATNTYAEGLNKVHIEISKLKPLADARLDQLLELETLVLKFLKEPAEDANAGAGPPSNPLGGGGMPTGIPGGPPPGMPPGMGGPPGGGAPPPMMGGMMPSAPPPNADELRRVLSPQ